MNNKDKIIRWLSRKYGSKSESKRNDLYAQMFEQGGYVFRSEKIAVNPIKAIELVLIWMN